MSARNRDGMCSKPMLRLLHEHFFKPNFYFSLHMKKQLILEYWKARCETSVRVGKSRPGPWRWYCHFRAGNGEIISQGETNGYQRLAGVKNMARVFRDNGLVFAEKKVVKP